MKETIKAACYKAKSFSSAKPVSAVSYPKAVTVSRAYCLPVGATCWAVIYHVAFDPC